MTKEEFASLKEGSIIKDKKEYRKVLKATGSAVVLEAIRTGIVYRWAGKHELKEGDTTTYIISDRYLFTLIKF